MWACEVITFDDLKGDDQPLNHEFPAGKIDWGKGIWWHSSPFGAFDTKSISFFGNI